VSAVAEKILFDLWSLNLEKADKKTWRSFNELRSPPLKFSPVTLRRNLPILLNKGLIEVKKVSVKGGIQDRYSITKVGEEWLLNPSRHLEQLDRQIIHLIGLSQGGKSDIKSQLAGSDLCGISEPIPHRLKLKAELHIGDTLYSLIGTWEVTDYRGKLARVLVDSNRDEHRLLKLEDDNPFIGYSMNRLAHV